MKLHELKQLLQRHPDRLFQLQLPDGHPVPVSFHITEVGHVRKTFIDCGGQMHDTATCQLQAWVANDHDHRLANRKLLGILQKAAAFLPGDDLPVEIEYEHLALSQYSVASADVRDDAVVLRLESKHTDCLAKELCVPAAPATSSCGCAPGACCA